MRTQNLPIFALTVLFFGCSAISGRETETPIGYTPWNEAAESAGTTATSEPKVASAPEHQPGPSIELPAPVRPPPPPPADDEMAADDEDAEAESEENLGATAQQQVAQASAGEQPVAQATPLSTDSAAATPANGASSNVDEDEDDEDDENQGANTATSDRADDDAKARSSRR